MKHIHKHIRGTLYLAITLLFSTAVSHVSAYTIDELMAHSVKSRDIIEKYQGDVKKSENNVTISLSNFIPDLNVSYEAQNNNLEDTDKASNFAITSTLKIFSGFNNYHTLKSDLILKDVSRLYLKQVKQDVQFETAMGFLHVYRKIAYKKVAQDALKLYRDRLETVSLKYETGLLTKRDLLEIKVETDHAEQEMRKAYADVQKGLNTLKRITGVSDITENNLVFDDIAPLLPPKNQKALEHELFRNRSEILILEKLKAVYKRKYKASKSEFYPNVLLSSSYERAVEDSYDPLDEDGTFKASLLVEMNIFDGMKTRAAVKNSYQAVRQAENDLAELKNEMRTNLTNILLDFKVAEKNLKVAQASVEEALENDRITKLAYDQGKATTSDLLDSIYYLGRARYNKIDASTDIVLTEYYIARMIEGFKY